MENSREQNSNQQQSGPMPSKSDNMSNDNMMHEHQNASANRGGTTDMDDEALRGAAGNTSRANKGSGMATKKNVTGSDYDGQISEH